MDERSVRYFLGESLKGQGDERAGVATLREYRDFPALEVGGIDWAVLIGSEYGEDAMKCKGIRREVVERIWSIWD